MAGTVTITYEDHATIKVVTWAWTSDASGDVSGADTKVLSGVALRCTTDPDGSAAPTDNYDIVVNDSLGGDVVGGALANRDTLDSESAAVTGGAFSGVLSLVVSTAGNAKKGVLRMYYR